MRACQRDSLPIVRALISFEADIHLRQGNGWTALHFASAYSKNEALMEYLVKHGADVKVADNVGSTILHSAAANGNLTGIIFSLRRGIDVESRDIYGNTPLHHTTLRGGLLYKACEWLLGIGADIAAKDNNGRTLLHRAVLFDSPAIVKLALEKGLKVDDRTNEGHSALDLAKSKGIREVLDLLRRASANELPRCELCEEAPASVLFQPCGHQYACTECCVKWKKCNKCGKAIERKIDVLEAEFGIQAERGAAGGGGAEAGAGAGAGAGEVLTNELAAMRLENAMLREVEQRAREKQRRWEEDKMCAICMERPKRITFDCGHLSCEECGRRITLCHVCRKPIRQRIKLFAET